ncbi:MAG: glycosyltransferase, partial [Candidatus Alcyoniella australis]|nr:glycosyltransferase [Candidatus Alcyoniella australis]
MKRHVLIVTGEMLPLPGKAVCGGGLRVFSLGQGLKTFGHRVTYSLPSELVNGDGDLPDSIKKYAHTPESLNRLIVDLGPDVVLFEQWGLATYLDDVKVPVVIDLHGSLALENSFKGQGNFTTDALSKIQTLQKADLLICPGKMQQTYFLSWFMLAGAEPREAQVLVVPLGMDPKLPKRRRRPKDAGASFVYGGINWPWIDPDPGLDLLAASVARSKGARLELFVGEAPVDYDHPLYRNNRGIFTDVGEKLAHRKNVQLQGLVSHDELIEAYLGADVAYDLFQPNNERRLAVTTRTVEYLWCGLPVIYGDYAELSAPIREYDAGWVIPPDDEAAIKETIKLIVADPDAVRAKGENARRLVRERYTWDRTVAPLARWVDKPVRRKERSSVIDGFKSYIRSESLGKIRERDDELVKLHKELREATTKGQVDLLDKSRVIEGLNAQLRDLSLEHDKHLRQVSVEHDRKLSQTEKESRKSQEKIEREVERRDKSLAELQQQIAGLVRDNEARLGALRDGFEAEKREFQKRLTKLADAKSVEIERIKARHEQQLAKVGEKLEQASVSAAAAQKELNAEIRSLNKRGEQARLDYEARLKQLATQRDAEIREIKTAQELQVARLGEQAGRQSDRLEQSAALHQQEVKQLSRERDKRLHALQSQLEAKDLRHERTLASAAKRSSTELESLQKQTQTLRERLEQAASKHQDELKQLSNERDERLRALQTQLEAKDLRHEQLMAESAKKSAVESDALRSEAQILRQRLEQEGTKHQDE